MGPLALLKHILRSSGNSCTTMGSALSTTVSTCSGRTWTTSQNARLPLSGYLHIRCSYLRKHDPDAAHMCRRSILRWSRGTVFHHQRHRGLCDTCFHDRIRVSLSWLDSDAPRIPLHSLPYPIDAHHVVADTSSRLRHSLLHAAFQNPRLHESWPSQGSQAQCPIPA